MKKLFKMIPIWENVPVGTKFEARIEGMFCEGRIQKQGNIIYLCQDAHDGDRASDCLGFHCSWNIGDGSEETLVEINVEILSLTLDPAFKPTVSVKLTDDYTAYINKGYIQVGCQKIPNEKVIELYNKLKH